MEMEILLTFHVLSLWFLSYNFVYSKKTIIILLVKHLLQWMQDCFLILLDLKLHFFLSRWRRSTIWLSILVGLLLLCGEVRAHTLISSFVLNWNCKQLECLVTCLLVLISFRENMMDLGPLQMLSLTVSLCHVKVQWSEDRVCHTTPNRCLQTKRGGFSWYPLVKDRIPFFTRVIMASFLLFLDILDVNWRVTWHRQWVLYFIMGWSCWWRLTVLFVTQTLLRRFKQLCLSVHCKIWHVWGDSLSWRVCLVTFCLANRTV